MLFMSVIEYLAIWYHFIESAIELYVFLYFDVIYSALTAARWSTSTIFLNTQSEINGYRVVCVLRLSFRVGLTHAAGTF